MRARQWILMAFAGLLGFSVAALCVVYAVSWLGPLHSTAATTQIGGPFTLVDDTGATVTEKNIAGCTFRPIGLYLKTFDYQGEADMPSRQWDFAP